MSKPIRRLLRPNGYRGTKGLCLKVTNDALIVHKGDYAQTASAIMDWYNDRLQIPVLDGVEDDPAVIVRLNADGTVEEIMVRSDLMGRVKRDTAESQWQKERDGE